MKKRGIQIVMIVMSVALFFVILVQWLWISNALTIRQKQFSNRIHSVLTDVVARVEQINYATFIANVNDRITNSGLLDNTNVNSGGKSLLDSLSYGATSFTPRNRQSYIPSNFTSAKRFENLTSNFNEINKVRTTEKIFTQVVDAVTSKVTFTKDTTREALDKSRKALEAFIVNIFKEADISKLTPKERLKDINLSNIVRKYLRYNGINLKFSVSVIEENELGKHVKGADTKDYYAINVFPYDWQPQQTLLVLHIYNRKGYLYKSIMWLLVASAFGISILLLVFTFTIYVIIRQKKLSDVKNDFINNMTHEFKTPIATISLATSAIKNPKVIEEPDRIKPFLDMIVKENKRMNKHVEKILHQARIDRKQLELNKEIVHLNDIIKEACDHFTLQCKENSVILECRTGLVKDEFFADGTHLFNCVVNIIDNAIKYSKEDPKIIVSTRKTFRALVISVDDNGIGLSKEDQKMIFTRFYRVTHGNLHKVKGFGLGLSYVKSIVEAHNGTINVKSKLNKGTKIELIFPQNI